MQLTPRMIEFCRNAEKVKEARQVMGLAIVNEMREIMLDSAPVSMTPIPEEVSPQYANILLGICRGYQRYHNLFEYFSVHFEAPSSGESAAVRLEPED